MNRRIVLIAVCIVLLVVIGCTLNRQPIDPAAPDMHTIDETFSAEFTITGPASSTNPINLSLTLHCFEPSYQELDVEFTPLEYQIREVSIMGDPSGRTFPIRNIGSGHILSHGDLYYWVDNPVLRVRICYTNLGSAQTCLDGQVTKPPCPEVEFNWRLLEVSCVPFQQGQLRFTFDTGARGISQSQPWVCFDSTTCPRSNGFADLRCNKSTSSPSQVMCQGAVPQGTSSFLACVRYPGRTDLICWNFSEFGSRIPSDCAPSVAPSVTPETFTITATEPPVAPPLQTCEDQKTYDSCKAFGGCYWWSTGGCYSYEESTQPPAPPLCSDYGDEKTCNANGCKWDNNQKPPCY